jgi:hypothetical protein
MTHQHGGAGFEEPVVWLVCTLEVIAVGYTGGDTRRLAAEVQVTEVLCSLVDTI